MGDLAFAANLSKDGTSCPLICWDTSLSSCLQSSWTIAIWTVFFFSKLSNDRNNHVEIRLLCRAGVFAVLSQVIDVECSYCKVKLKALAEIKVESILSLFHL